jgi:hypothetical protein
VPRAAGGFREIAGSCGLASKMVQAGALRKSIVEIDFCLDSLADIVANSAVNK